MRYAVSNLGHEVIGIEDSFNGLLSNPCRIRKLGPDDVSGILNRGGTILGTSNTGSPFKRKKPEDPDPSEKIQKVVKSFTEIGLDALIVIGGDGTQGIAYQFSKLGIPIVGIPKTIDNDLAHADVTVGFETAIEVSSDAILRLQSTAESHERIMILEVMGRHAGHIALHSGMASGAHIILIPEIPFSYEAIVRKIQERQRHDKHYSVIVVAEGAMEKGAEPIYRPSASGKLQLGGIGNVLANKLYDMTGMETRITVLGHIQRGGQPCPRDRILGSLYGVKAVDMVLAKQFGHVVVMHEHRMKAVPYDVVANTFRPLAPDDIYLTAAEAIGVCLGR